MTDRPPTRDSLMATDALRDALHAIARADALNIANQHAILPALIIYMGLREVSKSLDGLREPLRSDHPLMGENFNGVAEGLSEIAAAIEAAAKGAR